MPRDYSLVLGIASISIIAVSAAVFLIDIIYPLFDPRVQVRRMIRIVRDLFRYNREFAIGAILMLVVIAMSLALRPSRPIRPIDTYVVPMDVPPSGAYRFGTNSRGQDVFWQLTFALRNTLALRLRRRLPQPRPLAGHRPHRPAIVGGTVDRVLMSINDTFIVIPLFPLLVLLYFVLREDMTWVMLALVMACLGWAYDARLIRSVMMSLKTREFTQTSIFSGMSMPADRRPKSICPTCCRSSSRPR